METPVVVGRLVAGLLLILANGYFVAIEFALTRARQFTEGEFVGDDPALERAWEMTQSLEIYLTTCQVGITASSIAVGIVAEPALAAIFEPMFENTVVATVGGGAIIAFLIINLVHLTHGEQTPTYLGVERSRMVCRYGATPLYWFNYAISPLITLGDWIAKRTLALFGIEMTGAWLETETDAIESRADLHRALRSTLERGDVSEERHDEVMNALAIGEMPVHKIMVDADDVVAISTEASLAENFDLVERTGHTRYPLVGESLDEYEGNVYIPTLYRHYDEIRSGETTFAEVAHPPMTVDSDTPTSDVLDELQAENQELALVVEDGEVVGLVTATDALEAVVGELNDPTDDRVESATVR